MQQELLGLQVENGRRRAIIAITRTAREAPGESMSIVLLLLLLAQFDPDATFSIASLRERERARNDLVNAVLTNNYALAKTALEEKADPNDVIILSHDENTLLKSVSARVYHYYSNGADFRPLHLAAGLGERDICQLLLAAGAKEFALSKGYDWVPAQYAAKTGHPDLASMLLGIDSKDDHYKIEISLPRQKLILYRDGAPYLVAKISTGRNDKPTPPGDYLVTDKIRLERSTLYKVPMPYFLRLSFSEYGIHYGVNPGHPASHGCIRVGSEEKAQKIFKSCPIGTFVKIE
jgi:L,D-transpeptidase catalytic domain